IVFLLLGASYLRDTHDIVLVRAVRAAAALLAFVLLTLQVRSLFQHDQMTAPEADFLERSVYVLVWGGFALAALWFARLARDPVALWAWRLSGGLALATVMLVQVLLANPAFDGTDVGARPILNALLLAYAVPAALAALARRWADIENSRAVSLVSEIAA